MPSDKDDERKIITNPLEVEQLIRDGAITPADLMEKGVDPTIIDKTLEEVLGKDQNNQKEEVPIVSEERVSPEKQQLESSVPEMPSSQLSSKDFDPKDFQQILDINKGVGQQVEIPADQSLNGSKQEEPALEQEQEQDKEKNTVANNRNGGGMSR